MRRIAFYGKGGIGKSTIAANFSALMAKRGQKVQLKRFYEDRGVFVTLGLYAPDSQSRTFYQEHLKDAAQIFSTPRELALLTAEADAVLTDGAFSGCRGLDDCDFYELSYPMIGGSVYGA